MRTRSMAKAEAEAEELSVKAEVVRAEPGRVKQEDSPPQPEDPEARQTEAERGETSQAKQKLEKSGRAVQEPEGLYVQPLRRTFPFKKRDKAQGGTFYGRRGGRSQPSEAQTDAARLRELKMANTSAMSLEEKKAWRKEKKRLTPKKVKTPKGGRRGEKVRTPSFRLQAQPGPDHELVRRVIQDKCRPHSLLFVQGRKQKEWRLTYQSSSEAAAALEWVMSRRRKEPRGDYRLGEGVAVRPELAHKAAAEGMQHVSKRLKRSRRDYKKAQRAKGARNNGNKPIRNGKKDKGAGAMWAKGTKGTKGSGANLTELGPRKTAKEGAEDADE